MRTNSAERLATIIEGILKVKDPNPNAPLSKVLSTYFGDQNVNVEFAEGYVELLKTFNEVRSDIENCEQIGEKSKKIYFNAIQRLSVLSSSTHFHQAWVALRKNSIKQEDIDSLHTLSDLLGPFRPIRMVDKDKLIELRDEAQKLRNQIEEDDEIDRELKIILIHKLDEIIHSISLYGVFGDRIFREKVTGIIGETIINPAYRESDKSGNIRDFIKVLKVAASTLAVASGATGHVVQLIENIKEFLPEKNSDDE